MSIDFSFKLAGGRWFSSYLFILFTNLFEYVFKVAEKAKEADDWELQNATCTAWAINPDQEP